MRTQKTYSRENLRSQIGTTGAPVGFDLGSQRWKAGQDLHQPNRLITLVSDRRSRDRAEQNSELHEKFNVWNSKEWLDTWEVEGLTVAVGRNNNVSSPVYNQNFIGRPRVAPNLFGATLQWLSEPGVTYPIIQKIS